MPREDSTSYLRPLTNAVLGVNSAFTTPAALALQPTVAPPVFEQTQVPGTATYDVVSKTVIGTVDPFHRVGSVNVTVMGPAWGTALCTCPNGASTSSACTVTWYGSPSAFSCAEV